MTPDQKMSFLSGLRGLTAVIDACRDIMEEESSLGSLRTSNIIYIDTGLLGLYEKISKGKMWNRFTSGSKVATDVRQMIYRAHAVCVKNRGNYHNEAVRKHIKACVEPFINALASAELAQPDQ